MQPKESTRAYLIQFKMNLALRSVYIAKYIDTIIVLHSFSKTTNGTDQKAMNTATARYKELMIELRKIDSIK